jgi:hypothetical protein
VSHTGSLATNIANIGMPHDEFETYYSKHGSGRISTSGVLFPRVPPCCREIAHPHPHPTINISSEEERRKQDKEVDGVKRILIL